MSLPPLREIAPGPSLRHILEIVENELKKRADSVGNTIGIVPRQTNVGIFWNDFLLVSATLVEQETSHVQIDLRRIGIKIFDDYTGLHVRKNVFTGNSFANCATALAVG